MISGNHHSFAQMHASTRATPLRAHGSHVHATTGAYASLAKNKKDIRQVEKVAVEFNSDDFDKRRYLKKWYRVDDFAKQIASKQYLDKLLATERITPGEHQRLQKEIRSLIQSKSLKKVDYDEQTGILYGIEQLSLPSIR
jgi:hypothetical protein